MGSVLHASDLEPVAAGDLRPPEGLSAWVVELGEAARRAEFRSELQSERGNHLRAWSSRRAATRARRRFVQELLAGRGPAARLQEEQLSLVLEAAPGPLQSVVPQLEEPAVTGALPAAPPPLEEPVADEDYVGPALLDRISAYTLTLTAPLFSTVTGPGVAAPTIQTEKR